MEKKIGWAIYIACAVCAAGIFNASLGAGPPWRSRETCERWAARDQSFSIFLSLGGPVSLAAALIITGFGYDGFDLRRHDCKGHR